MAFASRSCDSAGSTEIFPVMLLGDPKADGQKSRTRSALTKVQPSTPLRLAAQLLLGSAWCVVIQGLWS